MMENILISFLGFVLGFTIAQIFIVLKGLEL